LDLIVYPILVLLFIGIFTREVIAPASRNHCDRRWLILAGGLGVASFFVTIGLGYFFNATILRFALIQTGEFLPDVIVGLLSFFITSFIFYWWHRAIHYSDFLWRVFHQLHHSALRVEALTAFYAHPLETAAAVFISSFSSYFILGASPWAAAYALLITGAFDLYLHSDANTPKWLGYFVQRPEMHTIHHERGHHAQNYGLPIWDIIFGTWANPSERRLTLGFDEDKSSRLTDMLLLKDVHKGT
jgi:sterol desaturase/sphingolipid hydroxylase (fatty acid hydroxylase superfamily)